MSYSHRNKEDKKEAKKEAKAERKELEHQLKEAKKEVSQMHLCLSTHRPDVCVTAGEACQEALSILQRDGPQQRYDANDESAPLVDWPRNAHTPPVS